MQHPFQCIASLRAGTGHNGFLVTACGPRLVVSSLATSKIVSEWAAEETPAEFTNNVDDVEERPAKKQKTNDASDNATPTTAGKKQKANKAPPKASNIIKLTVPPSQSHIVAVTDDKCIRVFSFDPSSGSIQELSRREMPKRPCAIQVLPDNMTILCGDKFGDVYSLPLLHDPLSDIPNEATPQPEATPGEFKPSATPLTVHSRRNLLALDQQKKQKNFTPRKDPLSTFTNTLLLGHVSMLTDVQFAAHTPADGKQRQYILTADRDEHIRISRAPPQTHVIEGFCLGHTAFISKIARVGTSELLVSGGGDSWLGVWDWTTYELKRKFDILELVKKVMPGTEQIAMSGIWSLGSGEREGVLVICEKVKAVFVIPRAALESGTEDGVQTIPLDSYPLDVVSLPEGKMLISVDARVEGEKRLVGLQLGAEGWKESPADQLSEVNAYAGLKRETSDKELDAFLYNVANLRKRGVLEGGEGEEAAGGVDEE